MKTGLLPQHADRPRGLETGQQAAARAGGARVRAGRTSTSTPARAAALLTRHLPTCVDSRHLLLPGLILKPLPPPPFLRKADRGASSCVTRAGPRTGPTRKGKHQAELSWERHTPRSKPAVRRSASSPSFLHKVTETPVISASSFLTALLGCTSHTVKFPLWCNSVVVSILPESRATITRLCRGTFPPSQKETSSPRPSLPTPLSRPQQPPIYQPSLALPVLGT